MQVFRPTREVLDVADLESFFVIQLLLSNQSILRRKKINLGFYGKKLTSQGSWEQLQEMFDKNDCKR